MSKVQRIIEQSNNSKLPKGRNNIDRIIVNKRPETPTHTPHSLFLNRPTAETHLNRVKAKKKGINT